MQAAVSRDACKTNWMQRGVPFMLDSERGKKGWPLISTTSCKETEEVFDYVLELSEVELDALLDG
jgi:hypothetical protein